MSRPLVSVITPTLNSAVYVRETLESVVNQTYENVEYIVVDGGSTDGTQSLVQAYPEVTLLNQQGSGMYAAINEGIRASHGEIVAYLNSDDLYFPHTIELVVNFFEKNSRVDMVYGDCRFIDEVGREICIKHIPPFNYKRFTSLNWSIIPQPTSFWRSSVHDSVGIFDDGFKMAGDFDFFIRVGKVLRIAHMGSVTASFRIHSASLSSTKTDLDRKEVERIVMKNQLHRGLFPWVRRTFFMGYYKYVLNKHLILHSR